MYYASYDGYKQCNNSHLMAPKSFTPSIEAEQQNHIKKRKKLG